MIYRKLGRTGFKVSQLGFGAMRLPMKEVDGNQVVDRELAIPMIHRAFDAGVNYIDTAVGYCHQDSQRVVGEAIRGRREQIVVSTKNPEYADEKVWWTNLEDSLRRLQVETIDIYNHHGLNWKRYQEDVEPRAGKWMRKALDQKLIRHICASVHDSSEGLQNILRTGYVASVTVQYNMLDRQLEDALALAHELDVGVVVMGPVAGGRLGASSPVFESLIPDVKRVPELALRFVLSNPNVTVALSGMSMMQQVEENVETASDEVSLSDEARRAIEGHLARMKEMAKLYCTGCGYCQPCPAEVAIPAIFEQYNMARVYGLGEPARRAYRAIGKRPWAKGKQADACTECGTCEPKCPQNIKIREQLKAAHAMLSDESKD